MDTTDARPKGGLRSRLRTFPYGEACLWIGFVLCIIAGLEDGGDSTLTAAGLFALAAIGVRATRRPKVDPNAVG